MTRVAGRLTVAAMAALVVSALALPALASSASPGSRTRPWLSGRGHYLHRGSHGEVDVNVCSTSVGRGVAHCDAHVRTDLFGKGVRPRVRLSRSPNGARRSTFVGNGGAYDPAYLQSAYNAPSATKGVGQTVAIVDAFDAPNAESDLAQYRSMFGLPACTTANGCFRKVNQSGGTTYPAVNNGWAEEISLDVQMVSAICPNCHILLVEATNASFGNLGTAVNTAVALGANVVSNSYGGGEWSGETSLDSYYNHPGVAIVASSGDNGYGVSYPAASPHVVAVGGTNLLQATNTGTRNATETVWTGAGSGCSLYEPKPAWQTDTGCSNRTVSDVSAVADPNTGVWVYDSADGGWEVFGGTSVAAPIIGSYYALAGNGASSSELSSFPYANPTALTDVVSGSNGACGGSYLCTGLPGYDGPTGLGTPVGAAAFAAAVVTPPPPPPPPPPAPDFAVSVSALSGPMKPGTNASTTVTITPQNGFTGTVSLSSSLSPAPGLTPSFSPSSVAVGGGPATSSLTIAANAGGTYTLTITATQGALVHKTSLSVLVNDFSIQVSPARVTVSRGKQAKYTVTLTPSGSFNSQVTLSVAGLRSHQTVSYSHNPAPASGTQTVTITTSTADPRGTQSVRIQGVSGTLNHSVTVVLTVQ